MRNIRKFMYGGVLFHLIAYIILLILFTDIGLPDTNYEQGSVIKKWGNEFHMWHVCIVNNHPYHVHHFTSSKPRRWSHGKTPKNYGSCRSQNLPPTPTRLSFPNYKHLIGNATQEFLLKHLIRNGTARHQLLEMYKINRSTMNVNKGDKSYRAVENACEYWAQDRIRQLVQTGEFRINGKTHSRHTLIVFTNHFYTILVHIEGIQGRGLQLKFHNITNLERHLEWKDGKINHYKFK